MTTDILGRPVDLSELKADLWTCTCKPANPGEEYVVHTTGVCPNCGANFQQALARVRS